jgi:phosphoribosyl 1,2-cyclic phosphate phosphodiesterase
MKVTILGTGTSVGVPRIGCACPVCKSEDPHNKRLRCSVLLEYANGAEEVVVLIDTTPDLRTQALRYEVNRLDAVLFTHGHADHLHGLDDVRCFCFDRDQPLPCYGNERTVNRIKHVFDYAFDSAYPQSVPQLSVHPIDENVEFDLLGLCVQPITVMHGKMPVLAFRMGDFAYVTDCSMIPDASMDRLRGVDTLVLDALRLAEHPTHFNIAQALDAVARIKPRRTFFTHVAHDLDHQTTNDALPNDVELAYDGLVLEVDEGQGG